MKRYLIKHSFNLQKGKGRLMMQGMMYATEDEGEIVELDAAVERGSCEVVVGKPDVKAGAYPAEPGPGTKKIAPKEEKKDESSSDDDLSTVKGVGATSLKKLEEKGITTKSDLASAMGDKAREDEMKEVFGVHYSKVASQFSAA